MSRLPLNALQAFEAVAAEQSFNGAARVLHVTPAAISQQIKGLEETLGYALFDRSGKSVCLTAEGARLLPGVRRGFTELRAAMTQARSSQNANRLNITTIGSFLQRWLLPRLPEFQSSHREIDLRLSASIGLINFSEGEFDAGIRFGLGRWAGLKSVRLFDEWLVPVCHPRLLTEHGRIETVEDLQRYPILRGEDEPWELWIGTAFGVSTPDVSYGPTVDDSASVVMAAMRGQGLALVRWSLASSDVDDGTLVVPVEAALKHPATYHFVAPPEKWDRRPVREFREWLLAAGAQMKAPTCKELTSPLHHREWQRVVRNVRAAAGLGNH
jgi:LysR family glycine cleavage system transcriptional activator